LIISQNISRNAETIIWHVNVFWLKLLKTFTVLTAKLFHSQYICISINVSRKRGLC